MWAVFCVVQPMVMWCYRESGIVLAAPHIPYKGCAVRQEAQRRGTGLSWCRHAPLLPRWGLVMTCQPRGSGGQWLGARHTCLPRHALHLQSRWRLMLTCQPRGLGARRIGLPCHALLQSRWRPMLT